MSIQIGQLVTAIAPGNSTSFGVQGGTGPFTYSVLAGGAGGAINGSTGEYTAPAIIPPTPLTSIDTVQVVDSLNAYSRTTINIDTALGLVCDIIKNQMGLDANHIYFWDSKVNEPVDGGLYVAVSVQSCKPFGNNISFDGSGSGLVGKQSINMQAILDIDIISRGPAARDQKEFVVMALQSVYSQQQQEANSFSLGRIPIAFRNLSQIDGPAIPYRFQIDIAITYAVTNNMSVPYFSSFQAPTVAVNP